MGLLTSDGKYVTLHNCILNVEQARNINTFSQTTTIIPGIYNVMANYEIYASENAFQKAKQPLEKKFINCITPTDKISGTNVHDIIYGKLKELYPGSSDL